MLYSIWRWIQIWIIPYGWLLKFYSGRKSLPANINLANGRKLKALMITNDYGILFSEERYVANRLKVLKQRQQEVFTENNLLTKEINELSFKQRELMYNREEENGI